MYKGLTFSIHVADNQHNHRYVVTTANGDPRCQSSSTVVAGLFRIHKLFS